MSALHQLFADARGHREEAKRARQVAATASGHLQSELLAIAALYDLLADGKDHPDERESGPRLMVPAPAHRPPTWRRKFLDWEEVSAGAVPQPENA
jgi:hypothetical protein